MVALLGVTQDPRTLAAPWRTDCAPTPRGCGVALKLACPFVKRMSWGPAMLHAGSLSGRQPGGQPPAPPPPPRAPPALPAAGGACLLHRSRWMTAERAPQLPWASAAPLSASAPHGHSVHPLSTHHAGWAPAGPPPERSYLPATRCCEAWGQGRLHRLICPACCSLPVPPRPSGLSRSSGPSLTRRPWPLRMSWNPGPRRVSQEAPAVGTGVQEDTQ